jgi:hypothetical protein
MVQHHLISLQAFMLAELCQVRLVQGVRRRDPTSPARCVSTTVYSSCDIGLFPGAKKKIRLQEILFSNTQNNLSESENKSTAEKALLKKHC